MSYKDENGGFGSAPNFSGSSTSTGYGAAATFVGPPAFGSSTFGSPQNIFGGTTPGNSSFGQTQNATGFDAIANQNTVGFGNLAQMAGQQPQTFGFTFQQTPPAFGSMQQSTFGGNSFSSWR